MTIRYPAYLESKGARVGLTPAALQEIAVNCSDEELVRFAESVLARLRASLIADAAEATERIDADELEAHAAKLKEGSK